MNNRLVILAERDLGHARDNLKRARHAAGYCDASKEWGDSGRSLLDIIAEYRQWEKDALEALTEAQRV